MGLLSRVARSGTLRAHRATQGNDLRVASAAVEQQHVRESQSSCQESNTARNTGPSITGSKNRGAKSEGSEHGNDTT